MRAELALQFPLVKQIGKNGPQLSHFGNGLIVI